MDKAYEPAKYEEEIRKSWERANAFTADFSSDKKPFCIIMPPPNANGSLHAGHLMFVVEDIITRYARMNGRPTLWLPGTDHAGIETQVVYERELAKKNLSRFDLGPQKFYEQVMAFTLESQGNIISQMKAMGFSADWSKLMFTLDEPIIKTVYKTFASMHQAGLIYRDNRIVNWCSRCNAAFSDIELSHVQRDDSFYTIDYGSLQIATTRPETIFADSAVAVNPTDKRYAKLIGKTATIPIIERQIPIIADEHVDPASGTGALKVTPAHDFNDYEIGKRHNLEQISVIDTDGKLINVPDEFAGLSTVDARQVVADTLQQSGKLIATTPLTHSVAIHERCHTIIEPILSEQWFLRIKELNKPVIAAIESEEIKFYPKRFARVALDWLTQEHDWCISRQIWWGIRIPVYYKTCTDPDLDNYIVAESEDEARKYYGEGNYRAETDTFDTWFSSGQWPYATLQASGDFDHFYPTTLMATARDILHKWVTRMIMFSYYSTGKKPFEDVYLWGMVTDENGVKLSKSKGNYGNPADITARYGTDALRLALSIGITPGNDGKISEEKIIGYRNFCNKLWNVARYITSKVDKNYSPAPASAQSPADHWILARLADTIEVVNASIEKYRFSEAGEAIYALLWSDFADKYIEYSKSNTNDNILSYMLMSILKLVHPYAPFVSEAIWSKLSWTNSLLATEQWPQISEFSFDSEQAAKFELQIIDILAAKTKDSHAAKKQALARELSQKQRFSTIITAKLDNKQFLTSAPSEIIEQQKKLLADTKEKIKSLEDEIGEH